MKNLKLLYILAMLMHPSFLSVIEGTNKGLLFASTELRQVMARQAKIDEEQQMLRQLAAILAKAPTKRDHFKQMFVGGESDWSKRELLADLLLEAAEKGFPLIIKAIQGSVHSPHSSSVWLKAYDIMIKIQQQHPNAFATEYGWNEAIGLIYANPAVNQLVLRQAEEIEALKERNRQRNADKINRGAERFADDLAAVGRKVERKIEEFR